MESQIECIVRIATSGDHKYATGITDEMAYSAVKRGTGIPARTPGYVMKKMDEGLAVIAINPQNEEWMGFCCVEVWQHEKYVANSGLIISPGYRGMGISKEIKIRLFELCRTKFPEAKIFSLTTSPAVMHVNEELGFKVIPYAGVIQDQLFLRGCNSWVNFLDLMTGCHANSRYVAMIFDPLKEEKGPAFSSVTHPFSDKVELTGKKRATKISSGQLEVHYG